MKNNLPDDLIKTLDPSFTNLAEEVSESIIPDLVDSHLFREIPFLSSAISLYKIGKTVKEIYHIKKIARFISTVNNGISNDKIDKYIEALKSDPDSRQKEIDYLIIILDRFIEDEKASLLGKLYLAFLDKYIDWRQFKSLSVSIDGIMMEDLVILKQYIVRTYEHGSDDSSSIARLVSTGLMIEKIQEPTFKHENGSLMIQKQSFKEYIQTNDGYALLECIEHY